jgi:hypothetical protein
MKHLILLALMSCAQAEHLQTIRATQAQGDCIEEQIALSTENRDSYTSEENDRLLLKFIMEQCL